MAEQSFFTPCYHYQQGMAYPHNQDICDHVPDIEGSSIFPSGNFQGNFSESSYSEFQHGQYYSNYGFTSESFPSQEVYESVPLHKVNTELDISEPVKKIYQEISQECEHFLLKESCNQCQQKSNFLPDIVSDKPKIESEEEITKLALSMKRKREQNKRAAARYREKKKEILTKTLTDIEKLEQRQAELNSLIEIYRKEILQCRKTLGLPLSY